MHFFIPINSTKLFTFCSICYSHRYFIQNPLLAFLSISGLIYVLGYSAFVGLAIIIITGPVSYIVGRWLNKVQDELMTSTDARVNSMNELLNGIRIIKCKVPFVCMVYIFIVICI